MHIYFLHHSAVCVLIGDALLIFDYYMDSPGRGMQDGHISVHDLKSAQRVYVFVSHSHHDHFNPRIFDWTDINPNITYILDATVPISETKGKTVCLTRGQAFDDGFLTVKEFGSTDIGGSFFVKCSGTSFFHAGDLNDWHWKDDGNKRYTRVMKKLFDREMKYLQKEAIGVDYAFFPVDRRIGSDHDEGADMFIDMIRPKYFIPIHMHDLTDSKAFADKHAGSAAKVQVITKNGDKLI